MVPRDRPGRVGTNPTPECHGSEAALRGGGDNARLPGIRPRTSTTSSPTPTLTPPRSPPADPCQKGSRPQPAPRTLRMTAPRDALSHDF